MYITPTALYNILYKYVEVPEHIQEETIFFVKKDANHRVMQLVSHG